MVISNFLLLPLVFVVFSRLDSFFTISTQRNLYASRLFLVSLVPWIDKPWGNTLREKPHEPCACGIQIRGAKERQQKETRKPNPPQPTSSRTTRSTRPAQFLFPSPARGPCARPSTNSRSGPAKPALLLSFLFSRAGPEPAFPAQPSSRFGPVDRSRSSAPRIRPVCAPCP